MTVASRLLMFLLSGLLACPPGGFAQAVAQVPGPQPAAVQSDTSTDSFNPEQLDALLAPIALYPDTLLTQMLMAATYPVQVVQAARWLDNADNKKLSGDALAKALQGQTWDPSVKSIVPFPQLVAMMSDQADWMQQLGYAFANQQADVLASIQRLRLQAREAGTLVSNDQITVSVEPVTAPQPPPAPAAPAAAPAPVVVQGAPQTIVIQPANPQVVYVPQYNPVTVYGAWPYPAYPPVVLPPPPGYVVGTALLTGLAFGAGIAITSSLWNVGYPNWRGGYANINVNRYNSINVNRTQINSARFQATRAGAVSGRPLRPPGGPVGRPARPNGLPANAIGRPSVRVPASAVNRPQRPARPPGGGGGLPSGGRPGGGRPGGGLPGGGLPPLTNRPGSGTGLPNRPPGGGPSTPNRPTTRPAQPGRPGPGGPAAGGPGAGGPAAGRPGAGRPGAAQRPAASQRPAAGRPAASQRPAAGRPAASQRPAALSGVRDGKQAANFGARGAQSRQIHRASPGGGGAPRPASGGGHGGRRIQR